MPASRTALIDGKEVIVTVEDHERQECEVWSRPMGYLRPTFDWNSGKRSEWKDRKFMVMPSDMPMSQRELPL